MSHAKPGHPNPIRFSLLSWAAWAPGCRTYSQWHDWALNPTSLNMSDKPEVSFIPAILRRRCSSLTRSLLSVASRCVAPEQLANVTTVFASRHGESKVTEDLLLSLAKGEPLSPMGFSLSVHNASSGIFSIATANKGFTTAIAARERTFSAGLIEALGLLNTKSIEKVLLVIGDDKLPEVFRSAPGEEDNSYALSLLIGKVGQESTHILSYLPEAHCLPGTRDTGRLSKASSSDSKGDTEPEALAFIKLLLTSDNISAVTSKEIARRFSIVQGAFEDIFIE